MDLDGAIIAGLGIGLAGVTMIPFARARRRAEVVLEEMVAIDVLVRRP